MKKRNFKYIKLIAGSLALATMVSACAKTNKEDVTPQIVYVYVTATPTPRVESTETTQNTTEIVPSETTFEPVNTTEIIITEPSVSENASNSYEISPVISETTIQNTSEATQTTSETLRSFGEFDNYVIPYAGDPTYETLDNDEIGSLIRVYNYFALIDDTLHNYDFSQSRDRAIEEARQLIDFIFYGAEMNGVTFAELTEQGRQAAYERLQVLDSRIMEYDPDYKTRISETYNRIYNAVSNFFSTTYQNAREAFNSHVDIDINVYPNGQPTESSMNAPRQSKTLKKTRN